MTCDGKNYPSEIDALFAGGLAESRRARLRGHLALCGACRDYYDRVAVLQQRLAPDQPLGSALFDGEDLALRFGARPSLWRRSWPVVAATAAVAIAGLVAVPQMRIRPSLSIEPIVPFGVPFGELQARGAARPGEVANIEGVRAFCLGSGAAGAPAVPALPAIPTVIDSASAVRPPAQATLRCSGSSAVQFAYSADRRGYLLLVGLDASGQTHWYAPHDEDGGSVALRAGAREQPLPESIRLAVNHRPGTVQVLALFSERRLSRREVETAITRGGADAACALAGDAQRLTLEITP